MFRLEKCAVNLVIVLCFWDFFGIWKGTLAADWDGAIPWYSDSCKLANLIRERIELFYIVLPK